MNFFDFPSPATSSALRLVRLVEGPSVAESSSGLIAVE